MLHNLIVDLTTKDLNEIKETKKIVKQIHISPPFCGRKILKHVRQLGR